MAGEEYTFQDPAEHFLSMHPELLEDTTVAELLPRAKAWMIELDPDFDKNPLFHRFFPRTFGFALEKSIEKAKAAAQDTPPVPWALTDADIAILIPLASSPVSLEDLNAILVYRDRLSVEFMTTSQTNRSEDRNERRRIDAFRDVLEAHSIPKI